MKATGEYLTRFAWAAHSYGTPDAFGEKPDVYAADVYLWGGYDGERTSGPTEFRGATAEAVEVTIRVRNYVAVAPLDSLTDPQSGEEWTVKGAVRGDNETIVTVYR